MLRRLTLTFLISSFCAGLIGAGIWLFGTNGGLQTALALARSIWGEQLQIEGATGTLSGPLQVASLRWQDKTLGIAAQNIEIDWQPGHLLRAEVSLPVLRIGELTLETATDAPASPAPEDLQLPIGIDAPLIEIGQFRWQAWQATQLKAALKSDGSLHQLSHFSGQVGGISVTAQARLNGRMPLNLEAEGDVTGQLDGKPLALHVSANGPLASLTLSGTAERGVSGKLSAMLTPFAEAPFSQARIQLDALDPSAWLAGAPAGQLDLVADIQPDGKGLIGSFGLTNRSPGPLDRNAIPIVTLAGSLDWREQRLMLPIVHAAQPGRGTLTGKAQWQEGALTLDLTAEALDARQIVSKLAGSRLNGVIETTLEQQVQRARLDLRDKTYTISAEAQHIDGQIRLPRLQLSAASAVLQGEGQLSLAAPRRFAFSGELRQFDPSRFGHFPKAMLNARWQAGGQLLPQPVADLGFTLDASQLAGQPLQGKGEAHVAWPRINGIELALAAGRNHLSTSGSLGEANSQLAISIEAPDLAPFGLPGDLSGHVTISGNLAQPTINGSVNARQLTLPGGTLLSGLALKADLGTQPSAPLNLAISLERIRQNSQTLLERLSLNSNGTPTTHRIQIGAKLPEEQLLTLELTGNADLQAFRWAGQLAKLELQGKNTARNLRLGASAPLNFSFGDWQVGPLSLRGESLDWQAEVAAKSDGQRLNASLKANGSRLGHLDATLSATQTDAWGLAEDRPWQGKLNAEIGNLAWLGEMIGEYWKTEGQLAGTVTLSGTPKAPRLNGGLSGQKLALRQLDQGMALSNGILDIGLDGEQLIIRKLHFDSPLRQPPRALRVASPEVSERLDTTPGQLEITGQARIAGLQGADHGWLDVHAVRLGVFQLPEQWITVSGEGRLSWQGALPNIRGKLGVDAGYWKLPPADAPRLSDDVVVHRPGNATPATTPRPPLNLDIDVDLGRNFLFEGAGVSSRLAGSLRIQASNRDLPRASGTIRTRAGRFEAYGQQLEIERGALQFNGLLDNPSLDVRAIRKGLSVEPGVQISGTARKPVVRLISDPELPNAEKLAWLVLGHGSEQMGAGDASILISAAGGLLGNDAGNLIGDLKKTFRIDEFSVRQGSLGDTGRQPTSRVAGSSTDTGASSNQQILSLGKRLSANTLLSYEQVVGRADGIVKLTVRLTRQIAIVGRAGTDNALDVLYTLTFGGRNAKAMSEAP